MEQVLVSLRLGMGADVAQLVEQLIRNEQVTGSIPAIGSIFYCLRCFTGFAFFLGFIWGGCGGGAAGEIEGVEELLAGVRGDDAVKPTGFGSLIFRGENLYDVALF